MVRASSSIRHLSGSSDMHLRRHRSNPIVRLSGERDFATTMHYNGLKQQLEGAVEHDQDGLGAPAIPNTIEMIDREDERIRSFRVKRPGFFEHVRVDLTRRAKLSG
jgi:hypothetical protein